MGKNSCNEQIKFASVPNNLGGGYSLAFLADRETDWLALFKSFLPQINQSQPVAGWTLLQDVDMPRRLRRRTWRVDGIPSVAGGAIILKCEENLRKWNFDRWFRGLFVSGIDLLKRVERARACGFTFPMRTFLVAERRERGFLRERISICEFIKGSAPDASRLPEIMKKVVEAHKFGLCWGGDPNLGNFMVDAGGQLRGLDVYPGRAAWRERAQDLMCFSDLGLQLPRFYPSVAIVRAQRIIKRYLKKLRGRAD